MRGCRKQGCMWAVYRWLICWLSLRLYWRFQRNWAWVARPILIYTPRIIAPPVVGCARRLSVYRFRPPLDRTGDVVRLFLPVRRLGPALLFRFWFGSGPWRHLIRGGRAGARTVRRLGRGRYRRRGDRDGGDRGVHARLGLFSASPHFPVSFRGPPAFSSRRHCSRDWRRHRGTRRRRR